MAMKRKNSSKTLVVSEASRHHHLRRLKFLFLAVLLVITFFLIGEFSLSDPEMIKNSIIKFGVWAPVVIIILQAVQSMISIIPSQVTTIAAGFLFGPTQGLVYSLIGATLGSSAIFFISRKYGERLALKFFSAKEILHFNALFKQKKLYALFLARVAPIFPNDLVSFAIGLTKVSFSWFTLISTLGFIVQMIILVFFGSRLSEGMVSMELILISVIIGLSIIILLFRTSIRRLIIKDVQKAEKELKGVKIVF